MNEAYRKYLLSETWKKKAEERMKIDDHTCQMCGCKGSQENPLQCHHFNYYSVGSENVYKDLVVLCRSCHGMVHRMMNRITDPSGRRGWYDNPHVPGVNVYTISGEDKGFIWT